MFLCQTKILLLTHIVCVCLFCFFSTSIFPSPDQELNPSLLPAAHNTGGSLPDLTNIQFPPPLSTPLDPEDTVAFPSLSSSNSTGSLTTNLTHLGISPASHGNVSMVFVFHSCRSRAEGRKKHFEFLMLNSNTHSNIVCLSFASGEETFSVCIISVCWLSLISDNLW